MPNLTRRSFIASGAAIPFSVWLERRALAQGPLVRYDARSPQGQAMLKTYADAVTTMKNSNEGDPLGWVFQWYTHWVNGATTKTDELRRIYPDPSPRRSLAEEVWSTCQAHGDGDDENNFLPWHRMFVLYFESIIRTVSGSKPFTLPYWNYSAPGPTIRGVIPPEFTKPTDPIFRSLYVKNRNRGVNDGEPIQRGQPGDPLSLEALAECIYESQATIPGFCLDLDSGLHGNVHVLIGDAENMGSVPYAARDPIFWLHHCNIDRLWASWNAGGRANPSLTGQFVFADENGQRVVARVEDVLDLSKLNYTYDQLEEVPMCPTSRPALLAAASNQKRLATAKATPIALGAGPVSVTLEPLPDPDGTKPFSLTARVKTSAAGRRFYLIVKDLRAAAQPGVLYHLYLELPSGATPAKKEAHHVGVVNFFNAVRHGGHGAEPVKGSQRFLRFDITDLVKALQTGGLLRDNPLVTIAPAGQPAAAAKPVIGEVTIVEQ